MAVINKYQPDAFEEKWRVQWEQDGLFQKSWLQCDVTPENKKYLLFAFAYPSGAGLHVGHVESATALDILARYYRSIGKKVFFPVGWDAFGLPAENYAIKTGVPPVETTKNAINTFRRQIKRLGISYDWESEIATCHPGYYQWTQWLFLKLFGKGLAYKKNAPVNWCPSCQTVLANEQVVEGKCERCGSIVEQKEMTQWFFKITQYKDELIEGLSQVDWPKATKLQQMNWIGKSEGARIQFQLSSDALSIKSLEVFTTAHDTIFGTTFLVIAPEHPLVTDLLASQYADKKISTELAHYVKQAGKKTEEDRLINKEKTGVFSGVYTIHPMTQEEIPVWVSDYVLASYGTGAIMAVPGHDERDYQFATKFHLPIRYIAKKDRGEGLQFISFSKDIKPDPQNYTLIDSAEFTGLNFQDGREQIMQKLVDSGAGRRETTYKLRDWLVSRQRYWGAPIPIVYDPEGNAHPVKEDHLPWILPTDVDFRPTGESPLRRSTEFQQRVEKLYGKGWTPEYDTMDTFVDSSWYFLRYTDPRNVREFTTTEQLARWLPVDFYMIGPEHIVLHLLYSRFFTRFLRDEGYLKASEPFQVMRHQGMILGPDGRKMSKSKGNVINPDEVIVEYGADTLRMYEMFMGPIEADKPWSVTSVQGIYRFLRRVWNLYQMLGPEDAQSNRSTERQKLSLLSLAQAKMVVKVTADIESLKFNTAISSMMEFVNSWEAVAKKEEMKEKREELIPFLKILSVFAPFIAEELWYVIYQKTSSIHLEPWPAVDSSVIQESVISIPVQINGKVRSTISVKSDSTEGEVVETAKKDERLQKYLTGEIKKVIYVQGKILNLIM